ncbi:hypothetical protein AYO38_03570 [bacterium SCGC AG-212-C10]|nr:hypothetical protein AYO38_03570 [bacterium SCGC AG-212-C10]
MTLPTVVRDRAVASGETAWIDEFPALVRQLESEWGFTTGRSYSGGSEAFVADVTLTDCTLAVLKLLIPRDDGVARNEIAALRIANGDGCVRLLRSDDQRLALLLERLGPPLAESGRSQIERRAILCAAARRLWRPAPGSGLPTGSTKGRWLIDFMTARWEGLGRPCSERALAYALACAERRTAAHDDARAVLVHGDIHEWNALQSEDGYRLIDPDGLLAEPEYDLGVIIRAETISGNEGDPRSTARALAHGTGLDATAIWEWAAAERLSTALVCHELDLQPFAREVFASAENAARLG